MPEQDEIGSLLVVEDDEVQIRGFRRSADPQRRLFVATTPAQARQIARDHHPELAIVDLKLASASGLDLVCELKERQPGMSVVLTSCTSCDLSDECTIAAMRVGADDAGSKPITLTRLLHRIAEVRGRPTEPSNASPGARELPGIAVCSTAAYRLRAGHVISIVEADRNNAMTVRKCLNGIGPWLIPQVMRAEDLVPAIERYEPSLLVFAADVRLVRNGREIDALDLAREVQQRWEIPVIFLSTFFDPTTIDRIGQLIACSVVIKPFGDDQLRSSVQLALRRRRSRVGVVDDSYASTVAMFSTLSKREADVLRCLMGNQRVPAISRTLSIAPNTVRNHLKAIFAKLGVHSQAELLERVAAKPSPSKRPK